MKYSRSALLRSTAILLSALLPPSLAAQEQATSPDQPAAVTGGQAADSGQMVFRVADGYRIEKVVDGLNFPTSLTWDEDGQMYVAEAGGALFPEETEPMRILRIAEGKASEVVNLSGKGVMTAVVGLIWHEGAFYITHRDADDLTGAVSRVTPEGEVETILTGIIDSQSEHQINDISVGPDGRMYITVGPAGNSGVVDDSIAPWVMKNKDLHAHPCQDIVLTGRNFKFPNPLTKEDEMDMVVTGAFVPFGTETSPGQTIEGDKKCGGAILAFDPANAEQTVEPYAWGFRNLLGITWNEETGEMYAAQNGYDIRGARPIKDEHDPVYRVREGAWYGVPDFSAALEPLSDPKFEPPPEHQAEVVVGGESEGKTLDFLIDHEKSGLEPPDKSLVLSLHPVNSSPSMIAIAPQQWSDLAGHVIIAEWGDLAPPTNPLKADKASGSRVVSVDPESGQVEPFLWNEMPGPASAHGAQGRGLDHPFEVDFGPDGALYVVDYGVVEIDMSLMQEGKPPYNEIPGTGIIWKITRTGS
jgi:glucose/arabinose dehydrogenase